MLLLLQVHVSAFDFDLGSKDQVGPIAADAQEEDEEERRPGVGCDEQTLIYEPHVDQDANDDITATSHL